jgi:hypothetical protein
MPDPRPRQHLELNQAPWDYRSTRIMAGLFSQSLTVTQVYQYLKLFGGILFPICFQPTGSLAF